MRNLATFIQRAYRWAPQKRSKQNYVGHPCLSLVRNGIETRRSRSPKAGHPGRGSVQVWAGPSQRSKFKFSALTSQEGIRRTLASSGLPKRRQAAIAIAGSWRKNPEGTFATIELDADERFVYIEPPYNYHWKKPE